MPHRHLVFENILSNRMSEEKKKNTCFIKRAFELASEAYSNGEIPVGAVVVEGDAVIGEGHNRQLADNDPSAHAEIVALRNAGATKNNFRLDGTDMYVTIEPCDMCREAIRRARIKTVYYASYKARPSTHDVDYAPLDEFSDESNRIIKRFFKDKR
jgi:tRNA(Arg) A34 adenosine deaminase TadA